MKNNPTSRSLFNSGLLAAAASFPWLASAQAQSPGAFSTLNVGDGTGSTTGDGTFVAEGQYEVSPLLHAYYQTAGSRMLWYPRKAAFRAGYGSASTWNEATTGAYSTAMGIENTASGYGSTAMGYYNNTASGDGSTAMGSGNTATGYGSTAMGYYNTASGDGSTAMGYYNNTASGAGSVAMGLYSTASSFGEVAVGAYNAPISGNAWSWSPGDPAFQVGNGHWGVYESETQTDLNGDGEIDQNWQVYLPETYSTALTVYKSGDMTLQGNLTLGGTITSAGSPVITSSSLSDSISSLPVLNITGGIKAGSNNWTSGYAFGPQTVADKWGTAAFGYNTVAGAEGALAAGWHCKAMGYTSVAFGHGSETYGYESMSIGRSNRAYGNQNFAGGWGSKTHNFNSFAYGHSCEANSQSGPSGYESDSFAIAMGSYAFANSDHTIALGYGATATATLANAFGRSLQANTMYEHNIGACAKISTHNDSWSEGDAIYRLGNSPDWNNRSDAITVLKNGQTILTNKAWSRRDTSTIPATADPSAATDDADGNALVVDGHTVLNGKVIISAPQGDISMGAYQ